MQRDLDITLVRAFVAVARTGSMTRAADRLGLTQGAVSQKIKRLEDVLQCSLFQRGRPSLKLTRDGEKLFGLSEAYLSANDEIWAAMTAPALRGDVKLGMPHDLVSGYLPLALDGFVSENPGVDVTLVVGTSPDLRQQVRDGQIDVALVEEVAGAGGEASLAFEPMVWIGSADASPHRKRPMPLSMVGEDCAFRKPMSDALAGAGIPWTYMFEHGTHEATMAVVRSGLALSVALASTVPDDLVVLGPAAGLPPLPDFSVNLYVTPVQTTEAATELARHIRERTYAAKPANAVLKAV
ncbi:MAG: LysR substrate-binding domain-containing protein [Alphaproteobacteria bacterium]